MSNVWSASMRAWFNQAENTCRPRRSRLCSCGHDVVRVVAARAEQLVRTDQRDAVRGYSERDGAVAPVTPAFGSLEEAIDVLREKRTGFGVGGHDGGVRLDDQAFALEQGQVGFRDVITERVKEARRDHLGAGRQFGRAARIETQQVDAVVLVAKHQQWPRAPGSLPAGRAMDPSVDGGCIVPAAALQLRQAHPRAAVTVHVPGAIQHIAEAY